ncbi:MAG: T9SS type A sorting domain-containing protein [Psychroserpens sp.]|uniref:T9SS type A sorting domain-containing protein n=1 Tax=Psychroserpens sp. TaxID=2020870 RepID=UPI003002E88A
MKKISYLIIIALLISININAQIALEGDDEFGRLLDLTYHPSIENRVFAVTLRSHIVVSNDNGATWDFFYSFPNEGARIQQLDMYGSDSLSFFVTQVLPENNVYILDINTAAITRQYTGPATMNATREWIKDYNISEANSDVIIINEGYKIGLANHYIVYYSTNGGGNWQVVYDGDINDSVSVNDVAIHPGNPDNIFISRGAGPTSVDGGLLVSSDSGSTFTEKLAGIELNAFKFDSSNNLYLGTGWSGDTNLYKSIDSGENWSIVPITWDNSGPLNQVNYITINPTNTDYMIVLSGDETAVSTDGGSNWTNTVYDIDVDPYIYGLKASYNPFNDGEVMIAVDKYPVKSLDGGATLTKIDNPFFFSNFASYNPNNGGHLYYGALEGIVHKDMSTGIHTINQETPLGTFTVNPKSYYPDQYITGRTYFRQGSGVIANLLVLENHGANIVQLLLGGFTSNIVDIETDPNGTDYIWVSFDDGTTKLFNTSLTESFTDIALPIPLDPTPGAPQALHFTTFINPANSNHALIGQAGRIYESLDQGGVWTEKSNGIDAYLDADLDIVYDIEQNPNNANELVASTSQGIFKTTDFGENWVRVFVGSYLRKIDYSTTDANVIIASVYSSQTTEAHLVYSLDNGLNWNTIPPSILEHVGSGSMAYQYENGFAHIYISTYDSGVVKYTLDIASLSTPNFVSNQTLNIFPNPTTESINIITANELTFETIEMFNISGQKVMDIMFSNKINISSLSAGIYLMRLKDNEGNYFIKKIIKTNK